MRINQREKLPQPGNDGGVIDRRISREVLHEADVEMRPRARQLADPPHLPHVRSHVRVEPHHVARVVHGDRVQVVLDPAEIFADFERRELRIIDRFVIVPDTVFVQFRTVFDLRDGKKVKLMTF